MTARIQRKDNQADPVPNRVPNAASGATLGERAPDPIEVGAGTAIVLVGTLEGGGGVDRVRIRVGAIERDVDAFGVPGAGGAENWWALVSIPGGLPPAVVPVSLLVRDGVGESELPLGEIELADEVPADEWGGPEILEIPSGPGPLIAIAMATHEPPEDHLRRQLDSIRSQGWERWVCVISDDASSPAAFAGIERAVAGDPRFVVSRSPRRLGFLRNFERALRAIPAEAELVSLADQDDRWYPDKLERLAATLAANPAASLAYSDMRITDGEGRVLSDTYWYLRRNRYDDMASLMVANVVTGAAALFRRELLADALPFPPAHPAHAVYHDHWLALCALGVGEIAYLDAPTYDYSRHDESVTVREAPDWLQPEHGFAGRARLHWRRATRRIRMGSASPSFASIYHERWLLIDQLATVLELRLGERLQPRHRRSLVRLTGAERSPLPALWLLGRCLRPLVGRNETLARERVLFGGLLWRWSPRAAIWRRRDREG